MPLKIICEFVLLAALWGASFLFMRLATPSFGLMPTATIRLVIAAIILLPLLIHKKHLAIIIKHWRSILCVGFLNAALPFSCYAYAINYLPAGYTSVINASTPMFGALVAYFFLKDKLTTHKTLGLLIGFIGVFILAWEKVLTANVGEQVQSAIFASLCACLSYGIAASFTKKYLHGVPALALAGGSMLAAAGLLLPFGIYYFPEKTPSISAWMSICALGIGCTGIAYILYFRLIASLGAAKATSVTFLIPVFGILWGALFLNEPLYASMLLGGFIVLFGTALTTGTLKIHLPYAKK